MKINLENKHDLGASTLRQITYMAAREDIRKHNVDEIRETIEVSKSLKKVRRTHSLGKNRMMTLLDKQG